MEAIRKPDSVFGSNLSGPSITLRLLRHSNSTFRNIDISSGTALHPGKDLAVSPLLSYPYSRVEPSTLGSGSSDFCKSDRHCSHLYSYLRRALPATLLSDSKSEGCPDFPPCVSLKCKEQSFSVT